MNWAKLNSRMSGFFNMFAGFDSDPVAQLELLPTSCICSLLLTTCNSCVSLLRVGNGDYSSPVGLRSSSLLGRTCTYQSEATS